MSRNRKNGERLLAALLAILLFAGSLPLSTVRAEDVVDTTETPATENAAGAAGEVSEEGTENTTESNTEEGANPGTGTDTEAPPEDTRQEQDALSFTDVLGTAGNDTVKYNELPANQHTLAVAGGSTAGAVTYEIADQPENEADQIAAVDAATGVLTIKKPGTVTVRATMEGDATYKPVSVERTITVEKADQAIAFEQQADDTNPYELLYGNAFSNKAVEVEDTSAGDGRGYGSGAIVYNIATVSGDDGIVGSIDAGTGAFSFEDGKTGVVCVTAYKEGDDCYNQSSDVTFYLSVAYEEIPAGVEAYTLSGEKADGNEWYHGDVTVIPAQGYLIGTSNSLVAENEWKSELSITQDGVYDSLQIYLKNETTGGITDAVEVAETIKLDKTAPFGLQVSYTEPVREKIINLITFGYYKEKVEVTLKAADAVSGVGSFSYYAGMADNPAQRTVVPQDELTTEADGVCSYRFEVPASFKGSVFFAATDAAGNESAVCSDGKMLIVDNTAPVLDRVQYTQWKTATETVGTGGNPPAKLPDYEAQSRTDVNLYYDDTAKLTFTITEENFDGKDVVLTDNGSDVAEGVQWSESAHGTWVGTLSLAAEGEHVVKLHYQDASGNVAVDYTSEHIIVDRTAPAVVYAVSGNKTERDGVTYVRQSTELTISVTEANFCHEDMRFSIRAHDAQGQPVALTKDGVDFAVWLAEGKNWSRNGDTWSAVLPCNPEAVYAFSVSVTDLAAHQKTDSFRFVVDGSAPVLSDAVCQGELKSIRDAEGKEVTEDAGTQWVYADTVSFSAVITEANFRAQDVKVRVYRDGKEVAEGDGYRYAADNWKQDSGDKTKYTLGLTLGEGKRDGAYQVMVTYLDDAGNAMAEFLSKEIVIDTAAPGIVVTYDNNAAVNGDCYNAPRTAKITVTDRNLGPDDFVIRVNTTDVEGNPVSFEADKKQSVWSRQGDVWSAELSCDADAKYTLSMTVRDAAKHEASATDSFIVDTKKADMASCRIEYSVPVIDKVLNMITFSYYRPQAHIRLYADDVTSGVDFIEWNYERERDAGDAHVQSASGKVERNALTYSNNGRTAMAEITLAAEEAAQYRGNLSFRVTDRAGNTGDWRTDNGKVVVVDTISPTRTVTYSPARQVVDRRTLQSAENYDYGAEGTGSILYYDGPMQMTVEIAEANFYAEDVQAAVDGVPVSVDWWNEQGDIWTGSIPVSEEGDHIVTITYTDRSSNEMVSYTSEQITIDRENPAVSVVYTPDERVLETEAKRYYAQAQTATITIVERNFRAEDVEAKVTAQNVAGDEIAIQDYREYLKRADSWVKDGDRHTARITFSADANYTFEIGYTDLALHESERYEPDSFVVDTVSPENLTVDYSENVFETIIETITFGFYSAQVTVTMTAEDTTSGIYQFSYNYRRSENTSDVNAGEEKRIVEESEIAYSNGERLATATFQIPSGELRADNQFNGTVSFEASDRAGHSMEFEDDRRLIVDNIAPDVEIEYSEPVQTAGDIAYYADEIEAVLTVTEANFYEEDVEIVVERDGQAIQTPEVRWTDESVDVHKGQFVLSGDGDYIISVSYMDRSENEMEEYHSEQLTIDTTSPEITIRGISNFSANRDEQIGFEVIAEDTNFDADSFSPKLIAEVREEDGSIRTVDMSGEGRTTSMGAGYVYSVSNLERDAVYTLTCEVTDMAGNEVTEMSADGGMLSQVMFSVNRNGSTYMLDENTRGINGRFSNEATDIVITEINVDVLEEMRVTMFKNDETVKLTEEADYRLSEDGGDGTWHAYTYHVYKDNFEEDGVYRLAVYSEDAAGNIAENTLDSKNVEISFGIDKTAPNLVVTNLESGMTYPVDNLDVEMRADDNMKLVSVEAILDGQVCASWKEQEIEEKTKDFSGYSFTVSGDETHAHNLRVVLTDAAGNEAVEEVNDFFVTTNVWVRFLNNRLLFFGSIGGAAVAVAAPVSVTMVRRRKKIKIK